MARVHYLRMRCRNEFTRETGGLLAYVVSVLSNFPFSLLARGLCPCHRLIKKGMCLHFKRAKRDKNEEAQHNRFHKEKIMDLFQKAGINIDYEDFGVGS